MGHALATIANDKVWTVILLNFSNKVQFNISSCRHFYHGKSHTVGMGSLSGIQRCAVCWGKSVSTSRYSPEPFFMDVHPNFVISNSNVPQIVVFCSSRGTGFEEHNTKKAGPHYRYPISLVGSGYVPRYKITPYAGEIKEHYPVLS